MDPSLRGAGDYQDSYQELELLGQGGFGKVVRVQCKSTDGFFAAKHIKTGRTKDRELALAEIQLLDGLHNPYIIRFIEAFDAGLSIIVVTEYLEGGELFERCADREVSLTEQDCCTFVRQICQGLEYLHSLSVVHLDLKPENIVITEKGGKSVKIIDFGSALQLQTGEQVQAMVGTAEFVAPEVANNEYISTETDMWSLGVVCFILLSGSSPFLDKHEDDEMTLFNISQAKYDFDYEEFDSVSADAKDFIARLLRKTSEHRLSAAKCLQHAWLRETPRSNVINVKNLRRFLARRKLRNVGRVLMAINVMRKASLEAARMRLEAETQVSEDKEETKMRSEERIQ